MREGDDAVISLPGWAERLHTRDLAPGLIGWFFSALDMHRPHNKRQRQPAPRPEQQQVATVRVVSVAKTHRERERETDSSSNMCHLFGVGGGTAAEESSLENRPWEALWHTVLRITDKRCSFGRPRHKQKSYQSRRHRTKKRRLLDWALIAKE